MLPKLIGISVNNLELDGPVVSLSIRELRLFLPKA